MKPLIKICGLSSIETLDTALDAGADMVGFVFHPRSPRYTTPDQAASLAMRAKGKAETVALLVDPDDALISEIIVTVRPARLQLHGTESPERVRDIEARFFIPVMKAVGVAATADVAAIHGQHAPDHLILLDAKPPKDAAYPGGHGKTFDWSILKALDAKQPFILSGGLTPENVAEAITTICGFGLNLIGVDVSSGVESAPGVKDVHKIKAFVAAARRAAQSGLP